MGSRGTLISRYIWLADTIRRGGHMTLAQISERWAQSKLGDGKPLPRRTFFNHRNSVQEIFGIEICLDPSTNEYYLPNDKDSSAGSLSSWALNSAALGGMMSDALSVSDRIFVEDVPSARQNLAPILDALRTNRVVRFTYNPFHRSHPTAGVVVEPYLIKLFRQRWYMTGLNRNDKKIKTYALDRITDLDVTAEQFAVPADFLPDRYFNYSFGIVVDESEPRRVVIRTDLKQAKYLRALPLHHSQKEVAFSDTYCEFEYELRLTEDFLRELMTLGPTVKVMEPPELRGMLVDRLRETLALYQ